jgi:pimeloyl-ACP methyl ester carboxylesterase
VIRRRYVDGRWGQVHLTHAGAGPPLLLLHQSPLSGSQFLAALEHLAQHHHVIALDTPGFGASDPPPQPASIAEHSENLAAVVAALGLQRIALLGHHTGASIAAAFAAGAGKSHTDKLILNGVPLLTEAERTHFRSFRFAPLVPQPDGSHLVAAWQQRLAASPGWTDLAAMHRHTATMLANPERYFWLFEPVFNHNLEADLGAISARTLILTNSGDDLHAASTRTHKLRPDWQLHVLQGGTHDIIDEQPQAWAAAVSAFLA